MARHALQWISFVVIWATTTHVAHAQLVRVFPGGGVSVRAPFVRVEVDAFGGTYVRAPFTSVYSPGDYYRYDYPPAYAPYGPESPYGPDYGDDFGGRWPEARASVAPEELAFMDWPALREAASAGAAELAQQLEPFETGESWQYYLQPNRVQELLEPENALPPSLALQQQFRVLAAAYDAVEENNAYETISRLESFQLVQSAIHELAHPLPHQQRLLATAAEELDESLRRWPTGSTWQEYLQLPPEALSDSGDASGDAAELVDVLRRFDRVQDSAEYTQIAGLPEFEAMRRTLADYLWLLQEQPPEERPLEELPALDEVPVRDEDPEADNIIELNAPANSG